ncbi:MAG TPA: hypothetical protein PLD05_05790 [Thermogutta sp.]|nr:hypothetical protein [Thermogutta sp.]
MTARQMRRHANEDQGGSAPAPGPDALASGSPSVAQAGSPENQEELPPGVVATAEWLVSFCHEALLQQQTPEALAARAYLQMQGLAWSGIADLPIGVLNDASKARDIYQDRQMGSVEDIEYWLSDARLSRVLLGPIRDGRGKLVTLWARPVEPTQRTLLYRRPWQERVAVYGAECLSTVDPVPVYVVEKILDALVLRSHKIQPAVAFGRRFDQVPAQSWAWLGRNVAGPIVLIPVGSHIPSTIFRRVRIQVERLIDPPEIWVLPPKRMFAPLGRMAAVLKSPEFQEFIRDRAVPLLGRKRTIQLTQGVAAMHRQSASTGPARYLGTTQEGPKIDPNQRPKDLRPGSPDWLAFD